MTDSKESENKDSFNIDISVGSNFYALLPRLPNTPHGALAEFIDNSISSFIKNRNLPDGHLDKYDYPRVDVKLKFDKAAERIEIHDNGAGISLADLPRALKPLEVPDRFEDTLNEHGYGMKGSAGWFAKRFIIYTSAYGEPVARTITYEFDKIVNEKLTTVPIEEVAAPEESHFTIITLEKFNNKRFPHTNTMKGIKLHLSDIYRIFIRDSFLNMTFNDEHITPVDVKIQTSHYYNAIDISTGILRKDAWKIEWKKSFEILKCGKNNKGVERYIKGFGALKKEGSHSNNSGMAIFNNGRILKGSGKDTNKPKALYATGNTYKSLRLTGEIHLYNFDTTASKDDLIWGDLLEDDLYTEIKKQLSGDEEVFLKLYNERTVKESDLNKSMPLLAQIQNFREKIFLTPPPGPGKSPPINTPRPPIISPIPSPEKRDPDAEQGIGEILKEGQDELKGIDISGNSPGTPSVPDAPFDYEYFNNKINSEPPWTINISSQEYLIHFKNEAVNANDLYTVVTDDDNGSVVKVMIHINPSHEFVQNFLGPIHKEPVSIFLRMIVSLAITEITLPNVYGNNDVPISYFRSYFNSCLTNHLSMLDIK